jgi:hypothetical protein
VAIALLLLILAVVDAVVALVYFQAGDTAMCKTTSMFGIGLNSVCSHGWIIDLGAAGISMALATLLLLRPDRLVLAVTAGWSAIAFLANLLNRRTGELDAGVAYRCPVYFLVLVGALVLFFIDYQAEQADRAEAAAERAEAAAEQAEAAKEAKPQAPAPPAA